MELPSLDNYLSDQESLQKLRIVSRNDASTKKGTTVNLTVAINTDGKIMPLRVNENTVSIVGKGKTPDAVFTSVYRQLRDWLQPLDGHCEL